MVNASRTIRATLRGSRLIAVLLGVFTLWAHPTVASAQKSKIEILHLWRTQSEQNALRALKDLSIGHGIDWQEFVVSGFPLVKDELSKRMAIGHPPNVVLWPLGREVGFMAQRGLTRTVTGEGSFFKSQLAPDILSFVTVGGEVSGIPIGIHVQNHIVYNQDILKKYSLRQPKTWNELIELGPLLGGNRIYLLANSDEPWQIRNLFVSIFSAHATADEARQLLASGEPLGALKKNISAALEVLRKLKLYAEPNFIDRRWEGAVRAVERGQALAVLLGDYVIPEFDESANIVCDLAPESSFVLWGVDTLIFPTVRDPQLGSGQLALFKLLANRDAMLEYARRKGALPTVRDPPLQSMRPCTAHMHALWSAAPHKILADSDSWNRRLAALGAMIKRIWLSDKIDPDTDAARIVRALDAIK